VDVVERVSGDGEDGKESEEVELNNNRKSHSSENVEVTVERVKRHLEGGKENGIGLERGSKRFRRAPQSDSISALKKHLADRQTVSTSAAAAAAMEGFDDQGSEGVPLEWGRILSQADFDAIRQLRHKRLVDSAMLKHGLKSASKRERAREVAEEEAEEMLQLQERLSTLHEHRVDPSDLLGKRRGRRDKEERMASVMEGEGRALLSQTDQSLMPTHCLVMAVLFLF